MRTSGKPWAGGPLPPGFVLGKVRLEDGHWFVTPIRPLGGGSYEVAPHPYLPQGAVMASWDCYPLGRGGVLE